MRAANLKSFVICSGVSLNGKDFFTLRSALGEKGFKIFLLPKRETKLTFLQDLGSSFYVLTGVDSSVFCVWRHKEEWFPLLEQAGFKLLFIKDLNIVYSFKFLSDYKGLQSQQELLSLIFFYKCVFFFFLPILKMQQALVTTIGCKKI
jgi:hypothetical protein